MAITAITMRLTIQVPFQVFDRSTPVVALTNAGRREVFNRGGLQARFSVNRGDCVYDA
jgi:hypothetical protein